MTRGSLVSKVVCADILLFKCQSVNYANGLQGPCINIYIAPPLLLLFICTHSHISYELLEAVRPCFSTIIKKEENWNMKWPLRLQRASPTLRPSLSSSPVLFFSLSLSLPSSWCSSLRSDAMRHWPALQKASPHCITSEQREIQYQM